MVNMYATGQGVRLTATFTINGVETDPTTVQVIVKVPGGEESIYHYPDDGVVKVDTGIYAKDIIVESEGIHLYKFIGTGLVAASSEKIFEGYTNFH